ncbi:BamA/TamA family outer membrane protein [Zobellia nedashkovskayae]|uniref:BamA/TamA family outer membrane protein n=1 Tax=Zobellia nedashkovskayae TaxID=2779510 RepID=UPI00188DA837|nr:BamA/TamA family outer membrane protein [Zobellia nedashkovskayae]
MYNRVYLTLSLLFLTATGTHHTIAQSTKVEHRVYLLGNTTDIELESPFYDSLSELLSTTEPFTVILNGDLMDSGKTKEPTTQDSLKIDKLLRNIAQHENGKVVIIPGDRDWANSGKKGLSSVNKLEKLVKSMDFENVKWAIRKGCPGPDIIELNDHLILVSISTQWYNHPYDKPEATTAECGIATERDFLIELENAVEDSEDKNILVAGHFPLESLGNYGGHFQLAKYLSPPIIGSLNAGYRQNIGSPVDIVNSRFDNIRGSIENIVLRKGSVIYAAGHEKNLQVLQMGENYIINSGSPTKAKYVAKDKEHALFAKSIPGLVELDYFTSGKVAYTIHSFEPSGEFELNTTETLFTSPCEPGNEDNFNSAYNPCKPLVTASHGPRTWATDTTAVAGDYTLGGVTKFFMGEHYRTTWKTPVKVPYLDLEQTFGGLSVYEKGGGHQTTSLKIKGGDGREYAFRSVDKDPLQLLPYELQGTIIARVMQDVTSWQQPYGAMAIGSMLNATDILHATPKLYMMPPSDELGAFKGKYSNLLGMLEEKPVNVKKVTKPFGDANEILQSRKMFRELYKDHDNKVDAKEYAKARMFDILVGDWGKHEDNWKWAGYKKKHDNLYRPIPRDRDYVFSLWNGLLPYFADRKWGLERGENFGYKINDIRSLTFSSQPADRRLLNELTREDWQEAATYIQTHITDQVIEEGINAMPSEIYEFSGKEIANKLKQRKKDLSTYANQYYKQLMIGGVEVVGSNKREYFEVTRNDNGSVQVAMYNTEDDKDEKGKRLYYHRTFDPKETKEIRLYGLDGHDVFNISGAAKKSIKIRVIGGPDPDVITDNSEVQKGGKKTLIYEKGNTSKLNFGEEGKMMDHWNKELYSYDRHRFGFNRYFPIATIRYNSNQGLGLNAGIEFTQKNAMKKDYSSKHKITGTFTTEHMNILKYEGRFHHVFKKWDIQIGGLYADHTGFTDFYGIGNGTIKDDDLDSEDFYETRYDSYSLQAGLIKDFWKKSSLGFQLNYENNKTIREEGTILATDNPNPLLGAFGLGDANLYEIIAKLDFDFRDRSSLPEQGARFFLKHQSGLVSDNMNSNYGITEAFFEQYLTTRNQTPITLGLRFGGSTTYGAGTIPFYKLKYLGQNSSLRGYVNNRFTGKSTLYLNTELRLQLAEFRTSIVPMKFGIKGFYDSGRVYSDFDTNSDWHKGYGFGLYLVPLSEEFAIGVSAGFSDEESALILFSIGSTF